ncbi:MAG: cytochrome c [Gammaproteobacteria bacterium]|nr:cytochrome c [Gammaproteobacteria bacterium]
MKQISSTLLFLLLTLSSFSSHASDNGSVILDYPPQSIANWYKPVNKRQAWLHTMFRLRRSMQALTDYSDAGDFEKAEKWAAKLHKDYLSISEMVPEWRERTQNELVDKLMAQVKAGDKAAIHTSLKRIGRSCVNCHDKSQAIVAAIYRSPDYSNIMLQGKKDKPESFTDVMEELPKYVNRVLIAIEDNNQTNALRASQDLADNLDNLSLGCAACHQKDQVPVERILGKDNRQRLAALQQSINSKQDKESRHLIAEIGVNVCARCHAVHRTLADLRTDILQLDSFAP